jgi:hypothetical protein
MQIKLNIINLTPIGLYHDRTVDFENVKKNLLGSGKNVTHRMITKRIVGFASDAGKMTELTFACISFIQDLL